MPDGTKGTQPTAPTPVKPLSDGEKNNWNKFIDFVKLQGINPQLLDHRDKNIGTNLIQQYNVHNPQDTLSSDIVPRIQQGIHDYRTDVLNKWKAGKVDLGGMKDENDFMPGISPVDGWPGSKTLSFKFPQAILKTPTNATVVGLADPNRSVMQVAAANGAK